MSRSQNLLLDYSNTYEPFLDPSLMWHMVKCNIRVPRIMRISSTIEVVLSRFVVAKLSEHRTSFNTCMHLYHLSVCLVGRVVEWLLFGLRALRYDTKHALSLSHTHTHKLTHTHTYTHIHMHSCTHSLQVLARVSQCSKHAETHKFCTHTYTHTHSSPLTPKCFHYETHQQR